MPRKELDRRSRERRDRGVPGAHRRVTATVNILDHALHGGVHGGVHGNAGTALGQSEVGSRPVQMQQQRRMVFYSTGVVLKKAHNSLGPSTKRSPHKGNKGVRALSKQIERIDFTQLE